jgi:hypothetical protein
MVAPTAMVLADEVTEQHVLSARPQAPTIGTRAPRRRGTAMRRLAALALRQLADHAEPRPATPRAAAAWRTT